MKVEVLGLSSGDEDCAPLPTTTFEGHGILSMALNPEYQRRERKLKAYLEARVGHIIAGNDTLH